MAQSARHEWGTRLVWLVLGEEAYELVGVDGEAGGDGAVDGESDRGLGPGAGGVGGQRCAAAQSEFAAEAADGGEGDCIGVVVACLECERGVGEREGEGGGNDDERKRSGLAG